MKKAGPERRAGQLYRADFHLAFIWQTGWFYGPAVDTGLYIKLLRRLKNHPG